jgi:hypothetical protein
LMSKNSISVNQPPFHLIRIRFPVLGLIS